MRRISVVQLLIWLTFFEVGRVLVTACDNAGCRPTDLVVLFAAYGLLGGAFFLLLDLAIERLRRGGKKRYLAPDGMAYTREELRRAYWSDEQIDELKVVGRGRS